MVKQAEHKEWLASFDLPDKVEFEKVVKEEVYPEGGFLNMGEVARKVSEFSGNKAVLVTDVGQKSDAVIKVFQIQ